LSEVPEPPPPDFVALVLGALAFGVMLGAGLLSLVSWTVRTIQGSGLDLAVTPRGLTAGLLPVVLLGTLGAILAAGLATWKLLAPIRNPWRQAMLALIAGLGSFALSLVTLPIDRAFGRPGLLVLAGAAALACLLVFRRLHRPAA